MTAETWTLKKKLFKQDKEMGTLKIKADCINKSDDTTKFLCRAQLVSRKWLCCGKDNPYLLIERARSLGETMRDESIDFEIPRLMTTQFDIDKEYLKLCT